MGRHPILARLALVVVGFCLTGLLLAGVELTLRALGLGDQATHDPFAGFTNLVPLFEPATRDDGAAIFRTARARARGAASDPAEFLAEKPDDGYRIFVVGGSSAAGVPYGYGYAFSGWLERRLRFALPHRHIEVVNAAVSGYSSRRALMVVREVAAHSPDLLIVYSGHNERSERRYYKHLLEMDPRLFALRQWIYSTRTYRLASRLLATSSEEPPKIAFDEAQNASQMFAVIQKRVQGGHLQDEVDRRYEEYHYRFNLGGMVEAMRGVGARTLLMTISQDFADWPPGTSAFSPTLEEEGRRQVTDLLLRGRLAAPDDCEVAMPLFERALELDEGFAELHFQLASCARELGSMDRARRHYRLASDLDRVPLGAYTAYNEIVREVAASEDALVVDVFGMFEEASPSGLVGRDLFVDLVHPNLRAHQLIAEAAAETIRLEGLIDGSSSWRSEVYREEEAEVILAADPELVRRERFVRAFACYLAQRRTCALAETRILIEETPEDQRVVELRRKARALPRGRE